MSSKLTAMGGVQRKNSHMLRRSFWVSGLCAVLLWLMALFSGCVRQGINLWDKPESGRGTAPTVKTSGKEPIKKSEESEKPVSPAVAKEAPVRTAEKKSLEEAGKTSDRRSLPERERVRLEALDAAKEIGGILRIKICYVKEDDEWWAFLYRDEGPIIDLKQFVWNRKAEKLEPFLVIRQIKKEEFDGELRKKEPGKTCTLEDVAK